MPQEIGREFRDTDRQLGTQCVLQNDLVSSGIRIIEILFADRIKSVTMEHIDILSLSQGVRDREACAFIDRMTSAQETGGVIKHYTVHTAWNVGAIYRIG